MTVLILISNSQNQLPFINVMIKWNKKNDLNLLYDHLK